MSVLDRSGKISHLSLATTVHPFWVDPGKASSVGPPPSRSTLA